MNDYVESDDEFDSKDEDTCYFYIIRLNDDSFKFGKANILKLRAASYNIGRLNQISFYAYIKVKDCADFERKFSKNVEEYKIRGRHELIKLPVNVLDKILQGMLDEDKQ